MELPESRKLNRNELDVLNRSHLYNFQSVGSNFDLRTKIFSNLNISYRLLFGSQDKIRRLPDHEFHLSKQSLTKKIPDNSKLDTIINKRNIIQRYFDTVDKESNIQLIENSDDEAFTETVKENDQCIKGKYLRFI